MARARRRARGPEVLDQAVDGDNLAGGDEQVREEQAELRPAELHRLASESELERSQDPEFDVHLRSQLGTAFPEPSSGRRERGVSASRQPADETWPSRQSKRSW